MRIAAPFLLSAHRDRLGFFVGQLDSGRGQVCFAADDRFHRKIFASLCLFCRLIEINRSENVAVIRHRNRRHLAALGLLDEVLYPNRPIEKRVFGVQM